MPTFASCHRAAGIAVRSSALGRGQLHATVVTWLASPAARPKVSRDCSRRQGWKEEHGYGDNVCGTLSWASCNDPVAGGDWLGSSEALVAHGLPPAQADPQASESVIINGHRKRFSAEVTDVLLGPRRTLAGQGRVEARRSDP